VYLQYLQEVPGWKAKCEDVHIPDDIAQLEEAISQHQALIEGMLQSYTDVSYSAVVNFSFLPERRHNTVNTSEPDVSAFIWNFEGKLIIKAGNWRIVCEFTQQQ
jgi:hypothetical protein